MRGPAATPAVWASDKARIDEAARSAGFPESDYPYYSPKNGCGPDGWRNYLVPELSHVFLGCDFSGACDRHDADYMTVGVTKEAADERFRLELHAAIVRYVEETRAKLAARAASPEEHPSIGRAARRALEVVANTESVLSATDRNFVVRWWCWAAGALSARREVMAACGSGWSAAKEAGEAWIDEATLSDAQVEFMHWEADLYFEAVRRFGGGRFSAVQEEQARYQAWVERFESASPR